jgi:hypothetical protein
MRINEESDLSTALQSWALHEAMGRQCEGDRFGSDGYREIRMIGALMSARPSMISRLLHSNPISTHAIHLEVSDLDCIRTYDNRQLNEWVHTQVISERGIPLIT